MMANLDPEALLENLDGWVLTLLKNDLKSSGAWEKLASLYKNANQQPIFSAKDVLRLSNQKSPSEALLNEFIKRSMTLKHLCILLEKAEMNETLIHLKEPKYAQINRQSIEGVYFVDLEDSVTITLEVSGFPLPNFLWYKGETPLVDCKRNELTIENFSVNHEGIYLCLVEQYVDNTEHVLWSSPVQLCVKQTAPFIIEHPSNCNLVEGDKIQISCSIKAYPDPTYTWFKDDEFINKEKNEAKISINNAKVSDGGSYKCLIQNCFGEVKTRSALVTVFPKNIASNDSIVIVRHPLEETPERSIGQHFNLFCSARSLQKLTFTWVVNGHALENDESGQYTVTSSAKSPDYRSSLFYTVSHNDGNYIRVLCKVISPNSEKFSKEVKIEVKSNFGPKVYTAGNKWALLIANTNYGLEPLSQLYTPSKDLQLIANELKELDFHCLLLTDLNFVEFTNSVLLFASFIKPGDYVIFCYAGHGVYSGIDMLMPIPDEDSPHEREALSSVWVRSTLQNNQPALLFIVLDMCRNINFSDMGLQMELSKIPSQRNCIILHATSEGYPSLENPKTSSVLTSSLVQHLQDNVDVVTMAKKVLEDIAHKPQVVRSEQIPKLEVNLWEDRSLKDCSKYLDVQQEQRWASMMKLPEERYCMVPIDGNEVRVRVYCTYGGERKLISNVLHIYIELNTDGTMPKMLLARNIKNKIHPLGMMKTNVLVYEMVASHRIKESLILTIGFESPSSGDVVYKTIHLDQPGISKSRIFDSDYGLNHSSTDTDIVYNII